LKDDAQIEVEKLEEGCYQVRVIEDRTQSTHRVTLSANDYHRLSGKRVPPEDLIKRSFKLLLAREPKESILPRFNLSLISRYFPEYERELNRRI
jgi:hypothetical protein